MLKSKIVALNIGARVFIHFLDFFFFFLFFAFSAAQKENSTNKKFTCQLNNKTLRIDDKVSKEGTNHTYETGLLWKIESTRQLDISSWNSTYIQLNELATWDHNYLRKHTNGKRKKNFFWIFQNFQKIYTNGHFISTPKLHNVLIVETKAQKSIT